MSVSTWPFPPLYAAVAVAAVASILLPNTNGFVIDSLIEIAVSFEAYPVIVEVVVGMKPVNFLGASGGDMKLTHQVQEEIDFVSRIAVDDIVPKKKRKNSQGLRNERLGIALVRVEPRGAFDPIQADVFTSTPLMRVRNVVMLLVLAGLGTRFLTNIRFLSYHKAPLSEGKVGIPTGSQHRRRTPYGDFHRTIINMHRER
ncbi:hypothetical protein PV325_002474 [Microctonus aethiopoides]|nr:hypothetical protein PV325_002474 [Microctonus aethiopoides]